ncbi:MAG: DNA adenine methylase [Methanobrevibacter sp.]|jgi:adenine-specific DNA methylase|nr:DNA adenine methylase [Candidatus Methanoflexus mossambicus]
MECQYDLFNKPVEVKNNGKKFPTTRYNGSKLKLSEWIGSQLSDLEFNTCLDAFGGTGSISYKLKEMDKKVTYNDILSFNHYIGKALIENENTILDDNDLNFILNENKNVEYKSTIQDNFKDIYFTESENQWLDKTIANINTIDNIYKYSIAFFALAQACIIKRPYNLFHRKNLYMRLSNVKRSFGNKTTWDTPFEELFRKFVNEANEAVFSNSYENTALNMNAFDIDDYFDLVYIDTPYISEKGTFVDYFGFYHFLEGLTIYDDWENHIDYNSKHHRLKPKKNIFNDKKQIHKGFDELFKKYEDSIIVVSYRNDGTPTENELKEILESYKSKVSIKNFGHYKYVLSKNSKSKEILYIGE